MQFEEIYTTYRQKIFRLCMGFVNDEAWAKDLTQETFIIVWKQLPAFRNESGVGTWIFRIATNHCLRQTAINKRFLKTLPDAALPDIMPADTEAKTLFLYKCIAELPEIERIIISLELENIRQAEIAKITGISATNVRVKIHRIKEKLTEKFKRYEQ